MHYPTIFPSQWVSTVETVRLWLTSLENDREVENFSFKKRSRKWEVLVQHARSLLGIERWRFLRGFKLNMCKHKKNTVLRSEILRTQVTGPLEGDFTGQINGRIASERREENSQNLSPPTGNLKSSFKIFSRSRVVLAFYSLMEDRRNTTKLGNSSRG